MNRVLIVDDKEENLYYLQVLLAGHGFEVETARHGAEALVRARQNPPELVISDLLMPVMDGYTLLRHWKADPLLKGIPFLVYTATYTEAEDERLALSLGADAFILKPAEPEDFLDRIREVRAGAKAAKPAASAPAAGDEKELLKVYSETLIRKLEEKSLQLEQSNLALQRDIAERTRMEESLRESEERFRATFEQAAVGIAHVGLQGRFLRVNDKLCAITGYPREELLERTFLDLTHPEEREVGDNARLAMLAGARSDYAVEKRYLRNEGGSVWVNVVTSLLRDAAGEPRYFITVVADITERKALEQQFLRAQRMESIGTLAGGIAHDLNNLLAPIIMSVGLLRLKGVDPALQPIIDNMELSAKRASGLVRQVLSFARGVEGERVLLQARHVLQEVQAIIASTFPKNIVLQTAFDGDLWPVTGDPTQLNQVVLNLCVNARDALPEGGRIRLAAANVELDAQHVAMSPGAAAGPHVMIEVTDTGCGIPREIVDRIFDPFFTTKEQGKGTGLGLSTVLGIVRSHRGAVNVYSEPGRGTTFRVYLPAQIDAAAAREATHKSARMPAGKGELVLVVDDETSILEITRQTLETFGYRVVTAENGARAVGVFTRLRGEVAAVITDMMMPGMDGAALTATLRGMEPRVSVITVSGLDTKTGAQEDARTGAGCFLPKPYTAEELLVLLRRVLDERAAGGRG